MAVSKGTSLGANAISNFPFIAASSHDGLAPGMYQKPDLPKQVTYQDNKHCMMHPNVILLVEIIMISIMVYNMD